MTMPRIIKPFLIQLKSFWNKYENLIEIGDNRMEPHKECQSYNSIDGNGVPGMEVGKEINFSISTK